MTRYRPATVDDDAVVRRRRAREAAETAAMAVPTGIQTSQLVRKFAEAVRRLGELEGELEKLKKAVLPVGSTMAMANDESPEKSGYPGTWKRVTAMNVPMTGKKLYIYERTE